MVARAVNAVRRMDAGEFVVVGLLPREAKTRRVFCPSGPLDESCPVRRRDAAAPHGLPDGLRQQQPLTRLRALTSLSRWEFRSAAASDRRCRSGGYCCRFDAVDAVARSSLQFARSSSMPACWRASERQAAICAP
jgi:hypothetical protein